MKSALAALLFGLVASASAPPPADACGVKLTIKGSAHKKGISRTSNPSDVLLVGSPPRRLSRDLTSAGHRVEVAPNPEAAKRQNYAVVIADNSQADSARQRFPNAVVMVRSGDVTADMRTVEKNVARKPVDAVATREPIKATENRPPIAAGPIQPKQTIVATAETKEPEVAKTEPKPIETKVEPKPVETKTVEPKRVETAKAETKVETKVETKAETKKDQTDVASRPPEPVKPAVTPKTVSRSGSEVYFSLASAQADEKALRNVIKWLKDTDVSVTIEGHADPSGNHDSNMALSEHRAEWVRDALVAAGIDSSRIEVKAFGDTQLKYGAKDRRNRRASIVAK
jgi:outer membrane protein OmpA-like peptidoglycan-associated protein